MPTMGDTNGTQLSSLKVRIKTWEKEFSGRCGRAPTKADISADPHIRDHYKKYWKCVKKSNMNEIWSHRLDKRHAKTSQPIAARNDVLDSLSKKMLDKYMKASTIAGDTGTADESFSFKKRLLKQRQQSADNQRNADRSGGQTTSESADNTAPNEPKLNAVLMRAKSIDESILRSLSNEFNSHLNRQSTAEEAHSYGQPVVDNNLINNIIDSIDVDINTDSTRVDQSVVRHRQSMASGVDKSRQSVANDVDGSVSEPQSSDSLDINDLEIGLRNTRIKRKSDVFDFEDEFNDNIPDKPVKKRIYADLDAENKRVDPSMPSIDENEDNNQLSGDSTKKKKFFVSKDRNQRLNSLNPYKHTITSIIGIDDSMDTGDRPVKMVSNKKKSVESNGSNDSNVENKAKSPKETSKAAAPKKLRKKKPETNYKRLNIKRKVFCSRGYKKFNVRKYKRNKWRESVQNNRNNCYKCGQSGHWAKDCTVEETVDDHEFDDELKGLGVSKAVEDIQQTISVEPLITNEELNEEMRSCVGDALISMGHKEFRPNQELTVNRILSGKSCLLIASTGSGKSLCYQLPAYLYWRHRKSITLVISPLISLMEDQLISVPKCLKAVCIHSGMSPTQRQTALNSLLTGESQVLLLSPEAITGGNTCVNLNSLPPIGFVCIDEAHCLSEWSNNFRPSYLQLYRVLRDKLKVRTFLALTATATKKTALTIARTLGLDPQEDIIGTTLVPDNLVLTVSRDSNKELALIDLLKSNRFNGLKSIIIYCTRREQTERLASLIRISFQEVRQTNPKTGKSRIVWDAQAYHAGMTSEDRNRVQKRFIRGDLRVIVATIAFGMGINKADIRAIIHYNLPKSFENYMQEIGRAGRDGLEAHCHLFLDSDGSDLFELQRHIYANSTDRKCLRKLIEKVFKSCKCRSIMDLESDESVANSENVCAGHEIAFPIEATVMEMDLKEETISTLITYLELDFCRDKVKLLSPINSMCTLVCYGNGSEQMKAICKECPIVAIAVTLYQKNNASPEVPSKLKFDLVEVCSMLGRPISAVRSELRQLEWQVEPNGRKKRTHARVMFSDLSFYLKSVGDMTDEQLNECLEFLHDFTQIQESTEVSKLRSVYLTFKQYSQTLCTNRVNQTKSLELKNQLNKYFNDDDNTDDFLSTEFSDEKFAKHLKGTGVHDLEDARRNVRDLLSIHGPQTLTSARVIARILQGIPSPRFPADVWGKCRRFWRADITVNFNDLLKIANEELIRLKTI